VGTFLRQSVYIIIIISTRVTDRRTDRITTPKTALAYCDARYDIQRSYYNAPKSQLRWFNLQHSPTLLPTVTAKHRMVKFQKISLSKRELAMEGMYHAQNTQKVLRVSVYFEKT